MASTNRENSVSSSQSVSMFDLEPNPFEQSFASTKKSNSVPGVIASSQQAPDSRVRSAHVPVTERNSTLSISEITSNNRGTTPNDQRKPSPFLYGAQKPNLASPPLLTPGGSKRLPPIIFPPNFIQQVPGEPSLIDQGPAASLATVSPKDNRPSTVEVQRPPLTLSLSRSGLIPNESNLRTGLTPNILTPGHQLPPTHYPYHPLPYYHGPKVDSHDELKPNNGMNLGLGVPNANELNNNPQSLTPGLGSLLAFPPGQTSQRTIGTLPRNGSPQADTSVQADSTAIEEAANKDSIIEPTISTTGTKQRGTSFSNSPSRASARKKRKTSVTSKGIKSTKNSQKSTSYSTDPKSLAKNNNADKESDDDQERKRKEFLERNRVAASKFRQRKKEYIKKVEMDLKFYEAEYEDMSRAMNKMCGINQGSNSPSNSLVCMLETAVSKNDIPSSLSILTHIKQVLYETRYFQRNGKNPRSGIEYSQESEEEDKHGTDKERSMSRSRHGSLVGHPSSSNSIQSSDSHTAGPMAASFIANGAPHSSSTRSNVSSLGTESASIGTDNTSAPSSVRPDDPNAADFPGPYDEKNRSTAQPVASAIGTISTLPDVINGRQVIPLNGIDPQPDSNSNNVSEIRQSSLVNITTCLGSPQPIPSQYPNSN